MAIKAAELYAEIGANTTKLQKGSKEAERIVKSTQQRLSDSLSKSGYDFQNIRGDIDSWIGTLKAATPQNQKYAAQVAQITDAYKRGRLSTDEARKALEGVRYEMAQAAPAATKMMGALKFGAGVVGGAVAFATAIKAATDQMVAFGKAGAEMRFTEQKFDNLSKSIGTTSDALLGDLKLATKGLVSDMELVGSAGGFMQLGLAKSHDEVVRLTRVAGALGMDMNQLVLTLTNQTTMRFDALGVSVDGFDEKVQKLKDSGMDASKAFTEAFLQQAEEQVERIGERADSAAAKYDRLAVAQKNYADARQKALAPLIGAYADSESAYLDEMAKHTETAWMEAIPVLNQARDVIIGIQAAIPDNTEAVGMNADAVKAWGDRYAGLAEQVTPAQKRLEEMTNSAAYSDDITERLSDSVGGLAQRGREAARDLNAMKRASDDAKRAQEELKKKSDDLHESLRNQVDALKDLEEQQRSWGENLGSDIGKVLEEAGLSAENYALGLGAIDEILGTGLLVQHEQEEAVKGLVDEFRRTGDLDKFKDGIQKIRDKFDPFNAQIDNAKRKVQDLKNALHGLNGTLTLNVKWEGSGPGGGTPKDPTPEPPRTPMSLTPLRPRSLIGSSDTARPSNSDEGLHLTINVFESNNPRRTAEEIKHVFETRRR